ncbi:MAG TPA: RNA pseudouridine synthase [Patescibacteria group bacterium]|nr:RNA pseudouridine synthase [Patescibacteria group bacterium]
MGDLRVLYEDNHLIAVYKPAGVLVQADDTKDPTLMDEVKYYLKQKYHKTGKVFLGLMHRLDRPVAGIILFAKTSKGASRLSEQFRKHEVEKIYHALVVGKPPKKKDTLVHFLKKDPQANRTTVYGPASPAGRLQTTDSQRAELTYEVVETYAAVKTRSIASLLRIILGTGRPHQIRAQLSAIGCPIVGDVKYGAPEPLPDRSLALAATSLRFKRATEDKEEFIQIDVPEAWQKMV